jgi:hypothetical protein
MREWLTLKDQRIERSKLTVRRLFPFMPSLLVTIARTEGAKMGYLGADKEEKREGGRAEG